MGNSSTFGAIQVPSDFNILEAYRNVFASQFTSHEKLVALALLNHWGRATETFPSVGRLVRWTSLSRSTVLRTLAALQEKKAIEIEVGKGRANRYRLEALMHGTSVPGTPVPEGNQCLPDTEPVSVGHSTSVSQTPEEIQEEIQEEIYLEAPPPETPTKRVRKAKRRAQAEVALPADWQPTEAHRAYAATHGLQLDLEVDSFRGWAEGRTTVSWNGTFTTRLANQAKWNGQRGAGRGKPVVQRGGEIRETKRF